MQFKDYYKILEVDSNATADQIKKSYRRLAMTYHPDRNPGNKTAEDMFKDINEAYDVLSNPEKRKKFDIMRDGKNNTNDFYTKNSGSSYYNKYSSGSTYTGSKSANKAKKDADDFDLDLEYFKKKTSEYSDFFNNFFRNSTLFKGDDFTGSINITLQEAYTGSKRIIEILGQKLRISILPGIADDQLLKIPEQGYPGIAGGKKGDLYVRVKIDKDNFFTRRGDELFTEIYVDIFKVILGGEILLRTLSGDIKITIPQGIEYGKQLRVKGKGMPVYNVPGMFGDLFVKVKYFIPKNMTPEQIDLIKQAAEIKK
ncbi:MAG: J domain-containing protein [Bacteroidales bacterium]|nr:J domain-containing protein [Bacteroidales bacterium]MBO7567173.1 J domain-containing protein [Bacteroidales bacterium]MBP5682748.1 J domain-containing protein [Bacteroidales bacterium]